MAIPSHINQSFADAIAAVVAKHWPDIHPGNDIDAPEIPDAYPAGWTIVIDVGSLTDPDQSSIAIRNSPGQRNTTTTGLLTYALNYCLGTEP